MSKCWQIFSWKKQLRDNSYISINLKNYALDQTAYMVHLPIVDGVIYEPRSFSSYEDAVRHANYIANQIGGWL